VRVENIGGIGKVCGFLAHCDGVAEFGSIQWWDESFWFRVESWLVEGLLGFGELRDLGHDGGGEGEAGESLCVGWRSREGLGVGGEEARGAFECRGGGVLEREEAVSAFEWAV
jgi:hypothetical protein